MSVAKACWLLLCASLWRLLVSFSPGFSVSGLVRFSAGADELCLLRWESVGVVDQLGGAVRPLGGAGVSLPLRRGARGCLCVGAVRPAAVVSLSAVPAVAARHGDSEGVRVLQLHLVLL